MSANVIVNVDLSGIESKYSKSKMAAVTKALTQQVLSDSNVYCKVDTYQTRDTATANADAGEGVIRWITPYAKEAYYDEHVRKEKNPRARSHWFEAAKSAHVGDWVRLVGEDLR